VKNILMWFVIGCSAGGLLSLAVREHHAKASDPRAIKIDDGSISGLRVNTASLPETEGELVKRQKELDEKDRLLKDQENRLAVEEQRLKIRIDELQKLQDEIVKVQDQNKARSDEIIKKIVKTFETMAPKKAAVVMSAMADDLAVDIVLNMKEKRVAGILEAMEPSRAMTISSLIAQRRPAGQAIGEKAGSAK